jgi:hypothetical protein
MRFVVTIQTENAIFHDDEGHFSPYAEVERLLRKIEASLPEPGDDLVLVEKNGNRCGWAGWRE